MGIMISIVIFLYIVPSKMYSRRLGYKGVIMHPEVEQRMADDFADHLKETKEFHKDVYETYRILHNHTDKFKLKRLKPSKVVGEKRKITLKNNRKKELHLQTLSRKQPLLFQIDDFLFSDECEYLKELAMNSGLEKSEILEDELGAVSNYGIIGEIGFEECDLDKDKKCNTSELGLLFQKEYDARLNQLVIFEIMKKTLWDFNLDGFISPWEWNLKNLTTLVHILQNQKQSNPMIRSRFSHQTWLQQTSSKDKILKSIQDRLYQVTRLPKAIIQNNEDLQVVKYTPGGHYDCHMDTGAGFGKNSYLPCCHLKMDGECNVCRFMTVLYYLSDVEQGGETAFPIAGQKNITRNDLNSKPFEHYCSLSAHCHKSKLKVQPKKGRAIIWYNHYIDPRTDWLGAMDRSSMHGGCAVHKGVKWIANNWIDAAHLKKHDMLSWAIQEKERKIQRDQKET
ncbi:transmembrane prolyl 4-hydroxylase-like [Clytia hemisphaerica]|uniref:Fe2OG dioxygenase domain-containing protein n=1 Tax=Clytia hemisphaerica TaxID=252671 RepID=A0A7M5V8N0_9CNID